MMPIRNPLRILSLWSLLTLCSLLAGAGAAAEESDRLRESLFRAADAALAAANEARANLLAPTGYADAAELYRRAEGVLESGGDIETIQRHLGRAETLFRAAAEAAAAAQTKLADALQTRDDAAKAVAADHAPELWSEAEQHLAEITADLERGRERKLQERIDNVSEQYRTAELAAIKATHLNRTRELLEIADELRARRYAPISLELATRLLAEAERELTDNRYDTDLPRNLAQSAEHHAHQAIYISELERSMRGRDISLEQILLDWQSGFSLLGDLLDTPVYFDSGYEEAVHSLGQSIGRMQADLEFLEQGVRDRDAEIASLKQELGGQTESLERVNQQLAQRQRQQVRYARIESLFASDEAQVLRQSDSLILRMIGLNFPSGQAALTASHEPLLAKVRQAIAEFPEANIVVEGHTDSFGSDALNLQLSQARAESVLQHLLANAPLSPVNLRALGYGESRPVANNETAEGRKRNRRIDIVIYPSW